MSCVITKHMPEDHICTGAYVCSSYNLVHNLHKQTNKQTQRLWGLITERLQRNLHNLVTYQWHSRWRGALCAKKTEMTDGNLKCMKTGNTDTTETVNELQWAAQIPC